MRRAWPPLVLLLAFAMACDDAGSSVAPPSPESSAAPKPFTAASKSETPAAAARPVMIDFTRDYCLPCQVMAPWVDELRTEYAASVDVVEVNIDRRDNERFALFFSIKSVPTQVFVDASGHIEARHEGVASKKEMNATLSRLGWIAKR